MKEAVTTNVMLFEAESADSFENCIGAKLEAVNEFEQDEYLEFIFVLENGKQVDVGLIHGKLFISEPYIKQKKPRLNG